MKLWKFLWRTFTIVIFPSLLAICAGLLAINYYYLFTDSSLGIDNVNRMIDAFIGFPVFILITLMFFMILRYRYLKTHKRRRN